MAPRTRAYQPGPDHACGCGCSACALFAFAAVVSALCGSELVLATDRHRALDVALAIMVGKKQADFSGGDDIVDAFGHAVVEDGEAEAVSLQELRHH